MRTFSDEEVGRLASDVCELPVQASIAVGNEGLVNRVVAKGQGNLISSEPELDTGGTPPFYR